MFSAKIDIKEKFTPYKIPGGRKIKLGSEECMLMFHSYYPEWQTEFYTVPSYLSKRDSLFKEDKGYTGEAEIAEAFYQSKASGLFISNFSHKDRNQILQSKSDKMFECDFIFITNNYKMWIIEVRTSKADRIAASIEEKFQQAIKNRDHILELADRMFGKEFCDTLRNICNCIVAIPEATVDDFERFKTTKTWESFIRGNPDYDIKFMGRHSSVAENFSGNEGVRENNLDSIKLMQFYATITLVKTSCLSFDLEKFLSNSEKKDIRDVTSGMHPSEYRIILSPEQWSVLEELPTHLQIIGEAATGNTELLKAVLFKILRYCSMNEESRCLESNISKMAKGVEQIWFIILGERPYLKNAIEAFIAHVKNKTNFLMDKSPPVELHMISERSAEEVEGQLLTLLKSKGNLAHTIILIDECYHGITNAQLLIKFHLCQSCWIAKVLAGQDAVLVSDSIPRWVKTKFHRIILRRLYRGTKSITMASSTLRLASYSDSPSYLANQFSYIESFGDIQLKDIDEFSGLRNKKDTLVFVVKGKTCTGSMRLKSDNKDYFVEEVSLYDKDIAENCFYCTKWAGIELLFVSIILRISLIDLNRENKTLLFKLLSVYSSRAVSNCTVYCDKDLQDILQNKLFPRKEIQFLRSGGDSESPLFSYEEIHFALRSINGNLRPLVIAAGTGNGNGHLLSELLKRETQSTIREALEILMMNPVPPKMKIVQAFMEALKNKNIPNENGESPLIVAAKNCQIEIVRYFIQADADVDWKNDDGWTSLMVAANYGHRDIVQDLIRVDASINAQSNSGKSALILSAEKGYTKVVQDLIKAGADVNLHNEKSVTPLILAAQMGHKEIVQDLIKASADVNSQSNAGNTSLCLAAQNGHADIVQDLIRAKADTNAQISNGCTALMYAAKNGHRKIVLDLIKADTDVNLQSINGCTALMLAAETRHAIIVEDLVKADANVDIQSENGCTSLMLAAGGGQVETVRVLIRAKADVDLQDLNGNTSLIFAVSNGHVEIVQDLVIANANVDTHNNDNICAIMIAAQNGHTEIVQFLIEANADVNVQSNDEGSSPLILAIEDGHTQIALHLINAGADVNLAKKNGETPIIVAARNGHTEIFEEVIKTMSKAKLQDNSEHYLCKTKTSPGNLPTFQDLLKNCVNVNSQDENGDTLLTLCSCGGHNLIVQYLIKAGADVNLANSNGETPLILAAMKGHTEIVKCLMNAKADINLSTKDGFTPLMFAAYDGNVEIVRYFLEAKADI